MNSIGEMRITGEMQRLISMLGTERRKKLGFEIGGGQVLVTANRTGSGLVHAYV